MSKDISQQLFITDLETTEFHDHYTNKAFEPRSNFVPQRLKNWIGKVLPFKSKDKTKCSIH